jgi:hypothetical protein
MSGYILLPRYACFNRGGLGAPPQMRFGIRGLGEASADPPGGTLTDNMPDIGPSSGSALSNFLPSLTSIDWHTVLLVGGGASGFPCARILPPFAPRCNVIAKNCCS